MSLLNPLKIGEVRTRSNLILSPMSGVTDSAFRRLVLSCSGPAVGLVVSEFIAAEGLSRDNAKTIRMMQFLESERPLAIQIFGADVDRMVRAAIMVEQAGADILDINCGCPAPKVVRRGGGAGLMREPARLGQVLRAVRRAVAIPVTIKIRSGWDDSRLNALEIARIAEGEGLAMLAVHGRTRLQLYRGSADWDLVAMLRRELSIPVVGSGDVNGPDSAIARLAGGYAEGIMIGRAALDNPWVFAQIAAVVEGRKPPVPGAADRLAALGRFRDALRESLPDRAFLGRYRGLACRLIKWLPGAAAARQAIGTASGVEAIDGIVSRLLEDGARMHLLLDAVA